MVWSFGGSTRKQLRAKYEACVHDFETRHGFSDHGSLVCVYKEDGGKQLLSVFWVGATHYAVGEDASEAPVDGTRLVVTGPPWRRRKPRTLWVRLGKGDWVV